MTSHEIELFGVAMLAVNGVFIYLGYFATPTARAARKLSRIPRRSIADVRDGERVRIVGTATSDSAPLQAPLSQKPCLGYQVLFAVQDEGGFAPKDIDTNWLPLMVRDATGIAHVPTTDALALVLDNRVMT